MFSFKYSLAGRLLKYRRCLKLPRSACTIALVAACLSVDCGESPEQREIIAAIERDKRSSSKSAVNALRICALYLTTNDIENAFKWVEESVDRGFRNYSLFYEHDAYKPLRGERLDALVRRIKDGIGLGKPVKQFIRKDLTGIEVSPSILEGKVLLIYFWATWCPPCIKEIPVLKRDYDEFKGRGFEIISISVDSDAGKLEDFIDEYDIEWPVVYSGKGFKDETTVLYGVNNVSSTWLVDRKGILRYYCLKDDELRDAIIELIDE